MTQIGRYKMIAIDLDGTLLSPQGEVRPRTRSAIHAALDAGLLICFATGRNWTESRTVIDAVGHYASAVFAGGAIVIDTGRDVTLHRTVMAPALAAEVCGFIEAAGQTAMALQDKATAGIDYLASDGTELNTPTRLWMAVSNASIHRVPRLADYPHEHTVRVGIVAPPGEVAQVKAGLLARFGERIVCHSLVVPAYDFEVMEVFDPAVNKWQGILTVAAHHGIDAAEIVAVGDDVNDLPMIHGAGLGVAMGNARPEVLAIADRVIGSNAEDGLADFLEELVKTHAVEPLAEQ